MCADGFDYRTAAGLHRDRLHEAELFRRAIAAKNAAKTAEECLARANVIEKLRKQIGRQLITLGEKMTA